MDDGFGGVNFGYDDDDDEVDEALFVDAGYDWDDVIDYMDQDRIIEQINQLYPNADFPLALEELNRLDNEMDGINHGRRNSLFDSPPPADVPDQVQGGQARRNRQRHQRDELVQVEVAGQARAGAGQRRPAPATVIDLTGDDDDEAVQHQQTAAQRASANPRRRRSQQQNAPRLNRSDANYVGDQNIIIISDSSDEDEHAPQSRSRNNNNINNNRDLHRHIHHHHHLHNGPYNIGRGARNPARPPPAMADPNPNRFPGPLHQFLHQLPFFRAMGNHAAPPMAANRPVPEDELVITGERNLGLPRPAAMNIENPLPPAIMLGGLNYMAVPFPDHHFAPPGADPRARDPKPQHVPPKPARPGFTRDTGEELVAVCPSCEQELAYDPDADHSVDTPTKSGKAKKSQREHHFWAVKACGHVYCKKCFDNRAKRAGGKTHGKNQVATGFRQHPENSKKTVCAVEDCESDVTTKTAWVGIFL
ncbi:hypothetical protein F5Y18DRAFT_317947 [Xylariaceae sp. FL1019]|nr:hypothetical protein F5Y18DRAFT_317947 [Xylariaceae sp. FL1019]